MSGPEGEEESEEQVPTQATRRGGRAPALPRTAKQVIDQAIGDNKLNEYLLYGFASVLLPRQQRRSHTNPRRERGSDEIK